MNNKLRFLPLIAVFLILIIYLLYQNNLNQTFFYKSVNSTIIKRNNWQLRATEFYLKNGLRIDSTYITPFELKIGDSISKKANTGKFRVYRKINNKYIFYKNYNMKK
jgi:hypothetical protein